MIAKANATPRTYRAPYQPIKYHGGKHYLAARIVGLFGPHLNYVEPYFGGGSVLLARDPNDPRFFWGERGHEQGVSEVVSDINRSLVNFWRVLQDSISFAEFQRQLEATPFSMEEWEHSRKRYVPTTEIDVAAAAAYFTFCRQSLAGRMASFTGITKTRTRSRMNNEVSAWLNSIAGLADVHSRLRRVLVLNLDALQVIDRFDQEQTLFYFDPPYLPETRVSANVYEHEADRAHHVRLLERLGNCTAKFVLSGYRSPLYDEFANRCGWRRLDFQIDNKASSASEKPIVTECVWLNYEPPVEALSS